MTIQKIILITHDAFHALEANLDLMEKTQIGNAEFLNSASVVCCPEESIDRKKQEYLDDGYEVTVYKTVEEIV